MTSTNNLQFEFDILIDPKGSLLILVSSIFKLLLQGSLQIIVVIKSPSASNSTEQNVTYYAVKIVPEIYFKSSHFFCFSRSRDDNDVFLELVIDELKRENRELKFALVAREEKLMVSQIHGLLVSSVASWLRGRGFDAD